jgi:hypothetical protein
MNLAKFKIIIIILLISTSCSKVETSTFGTSTVNTSTLDTVKPVIQLNGGSILYLEVNETYYELGATAYDDKDGNLEVQQNGAVDTSKVGQYKITYFVKDKTGNESSTIRTINVLDRTKPVINLLGESVLEIEIGEPFIDFGVSVIDNHDKNLEYLVEGLVNNEILGKYTLTYKAVDSSGNVSEKITRIVNVVYQPPANVTPEAAFYFDKSKNTIEGYKREFGRNIVIPKVIDGVLVKYIGVQAFSNRNDNDNKLTSVTLPNSILEIGDGAFYWNDLNEIILPESVIKIADGAFSYNKIKKLMLPDSILELGFAAFGNNEISDLKLSSKLETIGWEIFRNNKLTRLVLPEGLKHEYGAFNDNYELEYIEIPESLVSLSNLSYRFNQKIKEIKIHGDQYRFNDNWPFPIELKKYK